MKPRFEPDPDPDFSPQQDPKLVDPEAYDASEQEFAASLERQPTSHQFCVDKDNAPPSAGAAKGPDTSAVPPVEGPEQSFADDAQPETVEQADMESWRQEVAAKLHSYRARKRPRPPRYPSLQLKFDPPESTHDSCLRDEFSAMQQESPDVVPKAASGSGSGYQGAEPLGKLLEFPRPYSPPPQRLDELAEPVLDRPRIVEVPDMLPPPPALGGILIEPSEEPVIEKRPGFELPLRAAPMTRRVLAVATDGFAVLVGLALFGYIFFRMSPSLPSWRQLASIGAGLAAALWAGYQYLLMVYTGTTPGLKVAKLHLSRFDGSPVPRRLRQWRVLASLMSALSLGLGYAWCFLDEDQLCWHDRITHTYMAPTGPPNPSTP